MTATIAYFTVLRPFVENEGPPRSEGQRIVEQLEEYNSKHGTYPPDLETGGIFPAPNPKGKWRYSPSPYLKEFGLLIWVSNDGGFKRTYYPERGWRDHSKRAD